MAFGLSTTLMAGIATTSADDTEIFFGEVDDGALNNPNVLFLLDNSGSMQTVDGDPAEGTRLNRVQTAMRLLLDQSSSFNVGLAAFQGREGGSAIRYPIGWLESASNPVCDNGVCPDETLVSRPESPQHTAVQNDADNSMSLANTSLSLANVPVANNINTNLTTAVSKTVTAGSDVFEAYSPADLDLPESSIDNVTTDWFWSGTEDADSGRIGYRFDKVELPPDAVVQSANITFTRTALGDQKGVMSVRIHAESTSTPLPYTFPSLSDEYQPLVERDSEEQNTSATVSWNNLPPFTTSSDALNDAVNEKWCPLTCLQF